MNDLLMRVWNLLAENERPEGMRTSLEPRRSFEDTHGEWIMWLSDSAAYDRLCQAAERKLHDSDWRLARGRRGDVRVWLWATDIGDNQVLVDDPDRLTAAALAIEAGKGGE